MTDAELLKTLHKYWLTRGTPHGPGHWKAIDKEFRRRIRENMKARSQKAASGEEAA